MIGSLTQISRTRCMIGSLTETSRPGSMYGSLTQTSRTGSMIDSLTQTFSHATSADWVHETALSHTAHQQTGCMRRPSLTRHIAQTSRPSPGVADCSIVRFLLRAALMAYISTQQQTGSMIGSLTQSSTDWVHDRLPHTIISRLGP